VFIYEVRYLLNKLFLMSNIYQHNFNNYNLRLSNSDYWDHYISYDSKGNGLNHATILSGDCLLINIDIDDSGSYSGDTLYSLKDWTGSTVQGSGVTLNDIGLTGIDNGFIDLPCTADTSGTTFLNTYTGSTLFLSSGDTRYSMKRVTGCTYDYPIDILSGMTEGNYARLCGGFYQGFFKLSDRTFFVPKDDNKFTWEPSDFCLDDPLSGNTLSGTPYNYQTLPTRYEKGWTAEFWVKRDINACSGVTATTLNDVYPNNKGFFYYMGTRSENKFWDVFSGETGYTTSSGVDLAPPSVTATTLNDNPFLVYNGSNLTSACTFTGISETVTRERDRDADIVENALGFRIKDDGSVGYRYLTVSGECSGDTYVTGTSVVEEYSEENVVIGGFWSHVVVRFTAYNTITNCDLINEGRRKGRLDIYVNGYLKFTKEDFDEFLFKDLNEHREKQQGVPFNYSFGGGTQGLIETRTINGPDVKDEDLVIEQNFAGSFNGYVAMFNMYGCSLDVTTIRYSFADKASRFGLVEGTVIFVDDVGVEIDFFANFYQGSIIIHYVAQTNSPVPDDITFDFVNEVGVISGEPIEVEGTITIPKGAMSASTIVEIDDDYGRLSDDYVIRTANYTSNTKMSIKRNDIVAYEVPVKSTTADIPGTIVEDTSEAEPSTETPTTTQPDNNNNNNNNNVDNFKVYYGKSTKIGVEETDITNLEYKLTTQIVNSHIELSEGNGYGFIIIPASMNQPSMFRNSEDGCNGFAIPMIDQGSIDIGEIGDETTYKMYRTYVPTYAKVDIWLCD
jgi:hypothetical protein